MQVRNIQTAFGPVRLEAVDSKKCKAFWDGQFVGNVFNSIYNDEESLKKYCEYILKVFNS